jgi:hypothetical protein
MLEHLGAVSVLIVVAVLPAGITWLKGKRLLFVLGFFLPGLVWILAACMLAHPSSWWARRFYGPRKMQRAHNRVGAKTS